MSAVAVIGWGSLIWDLDTLAPLVEGPWHITGGPRLPLEFSRVSPKRLMGLAVCLDPEHGAPCPSHAIRSIRGRVAEAVADLAARERTTEGRIGAVCLASGQSQGRLPQVVEAVRTWCAATGHTGAVWTDLESNFREHLGRPFGVAAAVAYLASLTGASREEAVRYIHLAPSHTDTPLRRALDAEPWWHEAVRALPPVPPPLSPRAPATAPRPPAAPPSRR